MALSFSGFGTAISRSLCHPFTMQDNLVHIGIPVHTPESVGTIGFQQFATSEGVRS